MAKWKDHPRVTAAFAPHAPYTVDDAMYQKIQAEPGAPILTHLAEIEEEPRDRVATLEKIGLLTSRLIGAHCIFVTDDDIETLKRHQVGVGLNMECNAKGGEPSAPAQKMYDASVRVGLGSDGAMSSNTADILTQMSFLSVLQKQQLRNRSAMPAQAIVEMATLGGARALHLDEKIGSLEAGKLADIVIVKNDGAHQFPSYDPYQTLVHAAFPADVRVTIVHGKVLMEEGRLLTIDPEKVRRAAEPIIASVKEFLRTFS